MEFKKTQALYEELKDNISSVFHTYGLHLENYRPEDEIAYDEWVENEFYKISQAFKQEYNNYILLNEYFFGCPIKIYKINYYKRMYEYKSKSNFCSCKHRVKLY